MVLQISFISLCFILDFIFGALYPHSFLPGDLVVTSCLGLSALVISQRNMDRIDSFLISVIYGLLYDFFISHSFLICTVVFALVNVLVSNWQKHVTESIFETCTLVFTTIFVKEFLVYFIMNLCSYTSLSFTTWLTSRAIVTLIVNGFLVVIIVLISRYVEDLMLLREVRIRKEESISWWKISLKQ